MCARWKNQSWTSSLLFFSVVIVGRGVVVSGKGIKRVIIVVLDAASVDVVAAAELVVRG